MCQRGTCRCNAREFAQSWRYKPGQYIAGASGCGPPALPYTSLSSAPLILYVCRPPGAASRQPRPTESTGRQAAKQTPLPGRPPQTASAPGPTPGIAHQARPRSQAGPGVRAATPLTLAAASHWPAGPSLGHACRRTGATTAHGPGSAMHL